MLILGDSLEKLKELKENSIDAVVTDPPYGLAFMGKKWDYDVPSVELWREVLRVLKPGGHLLSFGGTRTYHRMVVNIEDAGFEIRDQIQWIFGSGFPKSHNISKAIDKMKGAEREVLETKSAGSGPLKRGHIASTGGGMSIGGTERSPEYNITAPSTDAAKKWQGWGTALKPANEIICVARKPLTKGAFIDILALELCQSQLFVEAVKSYLTLNQKEKAPQDIALWIAGKGTLTQECLFALMDMFLLRSKEYTNLSIELSWLCTLAVILKNANTFTTETASSLTMSIKQFLIL